MCHILLFGNANYCPISLSKVYTSHSTRIWNLSLKNSFPRKRTKLYKNLNVDSEIEEEQVFTGIQTTPTGYNAIKFFNHVSTVYGMVEQLQKWKVC